MLRRHTSRRGRRGYTIFFLGVLLPGLLFGAALSVDAARIIMASHQAGAAADVVSMAGATGVSLTTNATLDQSMAQMRAGQAFSKAMSSEMISSSLTPRLAIVSVTDNQITVEVQYKVDDLLLFKYFGSTRSMSGVARRSAGPCLSGSDAASCAYLR